MEAVFAYRKFVQVRTGKQLLFENRVAITRILHVCYVKFVRLALGAIALRQSLHKRVKRRVFYLCFFFVFIK